MNNVHVVYVEVVYILDHFTIRKFPMSLQINGNIDWLKQSFLIFFIFLLRLKKKEHKNS